MADIGSTLREARMRAGTDIGEVERKTKIRAKYLRAMENEEWDLLPGPVYVKSFLRTYGDFLGLDTQALLDDYKRRYERPNDGELRPISSVSRDRERAARGPLLPPWAFVAAALVVVVVALYLVGSGNKSKQDTGVTGIKGRNAHRHRHRPRKQPTTRAPAAPKPTSTKLELVPTGSVYVCVTNGAGKRLIPGQTFAQGETVPTATARKLLVTLGNNAVQMKIDGRSVPLQASSSAIGLQVVAGKARKLPPGKQPTCA